MSRKRKGKRPGGARPAGKPAAASSPSPRVSAADERPPAPWGRFPLAELVIFAGIVSLLIGVFGGSTTAIGIGVACAGLGGLEVAIREHFAGYRSHTSLLAGFVFVLVTALVWYVGDAILAVALAIGAIAFAITFYLARRAFQRASGGLSFRVGGMRG